MRSQRKASLFVSSIIAEREPNDRSTWEDSISQLSGQFADIVSLGQLTAAEINNYLMGFRDNPEMAVSNALDWVRGRREASLPAAVAE